MEESGGELIDDSGQEQDYTEGIEVDGDEIRPKDEIIVSDELQADGYQCSNSSNNSWIEEKYEIVENDSDSQGTDEYYCILTTSSPQEKRYVCSTCHSSFPVKEDVRQHIVDNHKNVFDISYDPDQSDDFLYLEDMTRCQICDKTYMKPEMLKKHIRTHYSSKDFTCKYCNKKFSQVSHLNNHYNVHTGDKNYTCQQCGKKFKQSGHLLNHHRIHTDERKFKCEICGKSFRQNIHLKSHFKTHTGEKDHRCILCNKFFVQSGQLQMHMRTHTNERKYQCTLCPMKFKQSGHLSSHIKVHEKQKNLQQEVIPLYIAEADKSSTA